MSESLVRFVRWQSYTMAQMSVVLALLGALSLSAFGYSVALAQDAEFKPIGWQAYAYIAAALSFLIACLASVVANLTRLLDFRLTARKARGRDGDPEGAFGLDSNAFGKATWALVWITTATLTLGIILMASVILPGAFSRVLSGAGL